MAKAGQGNVEHHCLGSTADNIDVDYCGDFAAFSFDQDGGPYNGRYVGWNADPTLIQTTFMIFYR